MEKQRLGRQAELIAAAYLESQGCSIRLCFATRVKEVCVVLLLRKKVIICSLMEKQRLGRQAELIAAAYLESQGYTICCHNYRAGRGEIDLIAERAGMLVFVEVKSRRSRRHGFPEEAVSSGKADKIAQTAQHYIESNDCQQDIRFDILSVELEPPYTISHFEDAFAP